MGENGVSENPPTPFEEALDKTGNGLYNVLLVATCSLILLAIGVDQFGFSLVVAGACDLNLSVSEKGILTSLPFVGILLVSYMWGYIADTKGRRCTLVIPLLISFIVSCLSSFSTHWLILGPLKFLSVCFSCAANSATYTLVGESCVRSVRRKYMLLMTCLVLLAPAVAAVLAYPTLKLELVTEIPFLGITYTPWRLLLIVLSFPSGLGAFAIYFLHESPKFLFMCGKKDEALDVLKSIYSINHRRSKNDYEVGSLILEDETPKKSMSFFRAILEQSAPLFRAPYLWRSLQLYYIVAIVYITNNSFLIWLPYILKLVKLSLETNNNSHGNICSLITYKLDSSSGNSTISYDTKDICVGTVEDNTIITLIASQSIYAFFNYTISYIPNRRKIVLITVLSISTLSGVLLNLTPETISSVIFFVMFTCTCLGMGILSSYFVDLYPTSYRGMVACLGMMVGRSCTFIGINLVGILLFNDCHMTFYLWSLLVLSSVIVAWFLPSDKSTTSKQCVDELKT